MKKGVVPEKKMTKVAAKALEASIKVWSEKLAILEENKGRPVRVAGHGWSVDCKDGEPREICLGMASCPLCVKFYGNDCSRCPIVIKHGGSFSSCHGTPYYRVADAMCGMTKVGVRQIKPVKAEVDFLISLRDGGVE